MTCGSTQRSWPPLCLAALVFVSGCDLLPPDNPPKPRRAAAVHPRPTTTRPSAPAAATPTPSTAPTAAPDTGASLIGLAEDQLLARLGPPTAEREDQPPGKTWRYQHKDCTVDFALYPDVETRIYRALAYEVINNDNSANAKRLCLAELEARPHGR
jgi:hypothetical protein